MPLPDFRELIGRWFGRRESTPASLRGFSEWTIPGIRFDDRGLGAGAASPTSMAWTDRLGAEVVLTLSPHAHPTELLDLAQARIEQRHIAAAAGRSLVSAESTSSAQGAPLLEVITKARVGPGSDYVGSLVANDGERTFVVRVTADERPVSGMREALVSAQIWELGALQLLPPQRPDGPQSIEGWSLDPYDPAWDEGALNSVTDDDRLDPLFPDHPLTRVRSLLRRIRESLTLERVPETRIGPSAAAAPRRGRVSDEVLREMLWKHNRFEEIEAQLREEVAPAVDPIEDAPTAERLLLLGIVQARRERHLDARRTLGRAHEALRRINGDGDVRSAVALGHLARANLELGDRAAAVGQFQAALPGVEAGLPETLALSMILIGYGRALLESNDPEAIHYVTRAQGLVERLGGGRRLFLLREAAGAPAPTVTARTKVVGPAGPR